MTVVFDIIRSILDSSEEHKARFGKDVPSMLKTAGILLVIVSLVCLATSIICSMITSGTKICINEITFTIGLFMICLSKFFDYGSKLEQDAEELI